MSLGVSQNYFEMYREVGRYHKGQAFRYIFLKRHSEDKGRGYLLNESYKLGFN